MAGDSCWFVTGINCNCTADSRRNDVNGVRGRLACLSILAITIAKPRDIDCHANNRYTFLKSNEVKKKKNMGNNVCNSNSFLRGERNVERFVPRVSLAKFNSFVRLNFVGSK